MRAAGQERPARPRAPAGTPRTARRASARHSGIMAGMPDAPTASPAKAGSRSGTSKDRNRKTRANCTCFAGYHSKATKRASASDGQSTGRCSSTSVSRDIALDKSWRHSCGCS